MDRMRKLGWLLFLLIVTCKGFAGPVVLVTGASRGIGHAIAQQLAREGYNVYAGYRSSSAPAHQEDSFFTVALDVTDQNSIDQAIQTIMEKEGRIDVLINNAGIMVYGAIENVTLEEAQKIFDVNFFGPMRMTQAVLPIMRDQKQGKIIQMSSRSGFRPLPSLSIYAASKFALEGVSETMAATLKPWNIAVSLIEPGPVKTDLDFTSPYGTRLTQDEDPYLELFTKAGLLDPNSPLAQEPEEIAALVQKIIETEIPHFRYQTADYIKTQAEKRFCDITGDTAIAEWAQVLFH